MKLSTFISSLSWASLFALIWLCLLGRLRAESAGVIAAGVFFALLALVASLLHAVPERAAPKGKPDARQ